jgi:hypothetical protein
VDGGYNYDEVRRWADKFGFTLHLRRRRQVRDEKTRGRKKARHWVVERLHSWMNHFRRVLVRWEKREETYVGMLHLALGLITWFHVLPK